MLGNGPDREDRMAALVKDTPLKRFGETSEVAAIAVLLASDEASYMTGAELTIDGGILAGSSASPEQ
jgi:NAD(P)-dependent dehydrogenase (short-subunit alcohol dehydrogenase family)